MTRPTRLVNELCRVDPAYLAIDDLLLFSPLHAYTWRGNGFFIWCGFMTRQLASHDLFRTSLNCTGQGERFWRKTEEKRKGYKLCGSSLVWLVSILQMLWIWTRYVSHLFSHAFSSMWFCISLGQRLSNREVSPTRYQWLIFLTSSCVSSQLMSLTFHMPEIVISLPKTSQLTSLTSLLL